VTITLARPMTFGARATTTPSTPPPDSSVPDLVELARRIRRRPDVIVERLRFLRRHPCRDAVLAAQSYWHANGFAKVKIAESHGMQVRLHIWPEGQNRLGDVDPHGHRWEFASWVAVGLGLSETYFAAHESVHPGAQRHRRLEYRRTDGGGHFAERGAAWLHPTRLFVRGTGSIYHCPLPVVHTVAPRGDGLVTTVVVQGPVVESSAPVYRLPDRPAEVVEGAAEVHDLLRLFQRVEVALLRSW
jgi:hypothetical protein